MSIRKTAFLIVILGTLLGATISWATPAQPKRAHASHAQQPSGKPLVVPAAMPKPVAGRPGLYTFTSLRAVEKHLLAREEAARTGEHHAAPHATSTHASASASITVTATVLPVITVVVDDSGAIKQIWSNSDDPNLTHVLVQVRRDAIAGSAGELDAELWHAVHAVLDDARAGAGRIA